MYWIIYQHLSDILVEDLVFLQKEWKLWSECKKGRKLSVRWCGTKCLDMPRIYYHSRQLSLLFTIMRSNYDCKIKYVGKFKTVFGSLPS
jgi:hypothetical protein